MQSVVQSSFTYMAKEGPRINLTLVHSDEMQRNAGVLRSVLNERTNAHETLDWTIQSYPHARYVVECVYHPRQKELAVLNFTLGRRKDVIEMENTHRRARGGSGVTVFSYAEHMAAALSEMEQLPVRITYPTFSQADTAMFLLRRGYTPFLYVPMGSVIPSPAFAWTYR